MWRYSKGYATLDYEDVGWRESNLVKIQLLVNKQPVDAICRVVHTSQVERVGRQWVNKFKQHVDRQMFGMFSPFHRHRNTPIQSIWRQLASLLFFFTLSYLPSTVHCHTNL